MKRKEKSGKLVILIILPIIISFLSMIYKSLWLIAVAVLVMFVLVGILPYCRKHENLWVFIITALSALPINWFLFMKYTILRYYLCGGEDGIISKMVIFEYMLILMGVEQVILGLIARFIWRKQYKLYIPVDKMDED